jgi:hypothetical protein
MTARSTPYRLSEEHQAIREGTNQVHWIVMARQLLAGVQL